MQLAASDLEERAHWAISLRWFAGSLVGLATLGFSTLTPLLPETLPLYAVAGAMLLYNAALHRAWRRRADRGGDRRRARRALLLQVTLDLLALTLLIYFTDLARSPLVLCYFFHIVIASILLPGATPYVLSILAALLLGTTAALQATGTIPSHHLGLGISPAADGVFWTASLLGFATCLLLTVFFMSSVSRQIERAREQLRRQEKMLGISQLVAGFAHQINNPLDGLQNCLRRLRGHVDGDPDSATLLRLMSEGLERMGGLAKRLQEFARPGGLQLEIMDPVHCAQGAARMLELPCREHHVRLSQEAARVPPVFGDAHAVQEVLFNLGSNAIEAMPHGGALSIRVFALPATDADGEETVVIDVVDNGTGILPEQQPHVFEPFFTTKGDRGGNGLGLGLCRMLLSEMGGHIELHSIPGRGSRFRVTLSAVSLQEMTTCASS